MAGKRSVDTNVVVRLLNGEPGLAEKFDSAEEIYVSPVVVGELFYGAANSSRVAENTAKVDAFLQDTVTLEWNRQVSQSYAEAKLRLRRKGKPIPENDLWIASFALAYGHSLVAKDSHFDEVDGLSVEPW